MILLPNGCMVESGKKLHQERTGHIDLIMWKKNWDRGKGALSQRTPKTYMSKCFKLDNNCLCLLRFPKIYVKIILISNSEPIREGGMKEDKGANFTGEWVTPQSLNQPQSPNQSKPPA